MERRLHNLDPWGMPEVQPEDMETWADRSQMEESLQNASSRTAPGSPARHRRFPEEAGWNYAGNRRAPSAQWTAVNERNDLHRYSDERPAEGGAGGGSGRSRQDPPERYDQAAGFHDYRTTSAAFATDRHYGHHDLSRRGWDNRTYPPEAQHPPTSSRYRGGEFSPGAWGFWDSRGQPIDLQSSWGTQQQLQGYTSGLHPDNNYRAQSSPQHQQQTRGYSASAPYHNDRRWPQRSPQQSHQSQYAGHNTQSPHREVVPATKPRKHIKESHKHALPIPKPTEAYLLKSQAISVVLSVPTEKLLILDLNGTLLCRTKGKNTTGSKHPVGRPFLEEFLNYVFKRFEVMVWSSAQPANAQMMVQALFSKEQREMMRALWARDTLGLSKEQYNRKMIVYKLLGRVWEGEFKIRHPREGISWDQTNTILMDDSSVKATAQPYNHIEVSEFSGTSEEIRKDRILSQCIQYLEVLRFQDNVSAFIRQKPFIAGGKQSLNLEGRWR